MFYGFNLGRLHKQAKPRKPFSKRTGLFDRQLKDELNEHYHHDHPPGSKYEDLTPIAEKRKNLFYKGGPDLLSGIIALGMVLVIIILFLVVLRYLS